MSRSKLIMLADIGVSSAAQIYPVCSNEFTAAAQLTDLFRSSVRRNHLFTRKVEDNARRRDLIHPLVNGSILVQRELSLETA